MKVVKGINSRKRERDSREQMKLAIMDLVREAQGDQKQEPDNSFLNRSARFIGATAGLIQRIFCSVWVLIPLAIAALYLLMHLAGISVVIAREADTLITVR